MNNLYLIVPSNLKKHEDVCRLINSIDISENIHLIFINQSENFEKLDKYIKVKKCNLYEIVLGRIVPLSKARNIGLELLYKKSKTLEMNNSFVMFVDDDAWFPKDTIEYILNTDIRAFSIKTIDPVINKAFSKVKKTRGEIRNWHLICDIVSICLVLPFNELEKKNPIFNEKLGLGNSISQGEESLFIYELHKNGTRIFYENYLIYHPYKKNFNMQNFYSMSYFWTWGVFHVSPIFLWPCVKYLGKYTIGLLFIAKDRRYFQIFHNVWKGAFDGIRDIKKIK